MSASVPGVPLAHPPDPSEDRQEMPEGTSISNQVILVVAPSGAGKSSLVRGLLARDETIALSISCTTRPPRPGEEHGREYFFIDDAEFARREAAGEFLESAHVHGNRYGTSREQIARRLREGRDVMLEIDWQGARQVRALFPLAVGIFILPPSMQALEERLHRRGQDSAEVIEKRLRAARSEMEHARECDYILVNEDFDRALEQFATIVAASRLRREVQALRREDLFRQLGVM